MTALRRITSPRRIETAEEERGEQARGLLAAGAWFATLAEQLGVEVRVAPQRGQIAHLRLPDKRALPLNLEPFAVSRFQR